MDDTTAEVETFEAWAERMALGIETVAVPHAEDSDFDPKAQAWHVTLTNANDNGHGVTSTKVFTTPFTMGAAHRHWTQKGIRTLRRYGVTEHKIGGRVPFFGYRVSAGMDEAIREGSAPTPPTVVDVVQCLADDSRGVENTRSFEEWANDYGYDTDSRKAERMYRIGQEQAAKLARFLGEEEFSALLNCEEA